MQLREILRASIFSASRKIPEFRGKLPLIRGITDLLHVRESLHRVENNGAFFNVEGVDQIELNLLYFGVNSPEIVSILERFAARGAGVFWDIGANLGSISLPVAALCPGLRVFAFEPSPPVMAKLVANANCNPELMDRVTIFSTALSDRNGFVAFHTSRHATNSGVGGIGSSENRTPIPVNIWANRGDDLIAQGIVPSPELIKIDVEGFELEVVSGLEKTPESAERMAIVFEHEVYRFEERGMPLDSVVKRLRGLGYDHYMTFEDASFRPLVEEDFSKRGNFLALKGWDNVSELQESKSSNR